MQHEPSNDRLGGSVECAAGDVHKIERLLNDCIVEADISHGFEEYFRFLDSFYDADIEASSEGGEDIICVRAKLRSHLYSLLLPVHVMVEVGGLSISVRNTAVPSGAAGKMHSVWSLEFIGTTGATCTLTWHTFRRWRGWRVVHERHYDHRQTGAPLPWRDLCMADPNVHPERFQRPS